MKTKLQNLILLIMFIFSSTLCYSQSAGTIDTRAELKYKNELDSNVDAVISPYKKMASYVIGAALVVGFIVVVYHLANNTGKGKKALISWLIAVAIYWIAISLI